MTEAAVYQAFNEKLANGGAEPATTMGAFRHGALDEAGPAIGSTLGAGIGAYTGIGAVPGAAIGYGVGALPSAVRAIRENWGAAPAPDRMARTGRTMLVDGASGLGAVLGTGAVHAYNHYTGSKVNELVGTGLGMGLGSLAGAGLEHLTKRAGSEVMPKARQLSAAPPVKSLLVKQGFDTSEYSGFMNPTPMNYRSYMGQPGGTMSKELPRKVQDVMDKRAGVALSPASRLAQTRSVGAPRMSAPGPSIAQISKPPGMGVPIPGATKS